MVDNGIMRCIIVDDDLMSRKVLEDFIHRTPYLKLSGAYGNPYDARNALSGPEAADLVLLDVEMPGMNGMELLNSLAEPPAVVIVSGKEVYALQAYDNDVADYLLKPVEYPRFLKAVDKARLYLKKDRRDGETPNRKVLLAKKGSTMYKIQYDDILYVEAMENYVIINTWYDKITIHYTMKALEELLPLSWFHRIHRSYIVNLDKVSQFKDNLLEVRYGRDIYELPVGKAYRKKFMELLAHYKQNGISDE